MNNPKYRFQQGLKYQTFYAKDEKSLCSENSSSIIDNFSRERQTKLKEKRYNKWIEELQQQTLEQTQFIQTIYTGRTSRRHTPLELNLQKLNKNFFSTPQRIFIHPKISIDYNQKKYSKVKNDFLHNYQANFRGDGKININEDPKALNIILYHQLNASGLASRRWNSVHAYRSCLNSTPLAPEFECYPQDPELVDEINKIRNQIGKQTKKLKVCNQYQLNLSLKLKHYLDYYKQIMDSRQTLFSTKEEEYQVVLDYLFRMKDGSQLEKFRQIDKAEDEVHFIKEKSKSFQRQLEAQGLLQQRKMFISTQQQYNNKRKEDSAQFYDETFLVKPNDLPQSQIILQKKEPNRSFY